jgi:protein SCO1/2
MGQTVRSLVNMKVEAPRRARRHSLFLVAAVTALGVVTACGSDDSADRALVGFEPSGEQRVDTVSLPDASAGDQPFAFRADDGGLLISYFGYTSCPDVCPTTLAAVRSALRDIGDEAQRVDLAMTTIDPARDTGELLTGYVQSFVDGAHALRTDDAAELRTASDAFGVSFGVETNEAGEVEVSHSGSVYVVDDNGLVVLTWPFGVTSSDMAADLETLFERVDA